MTAKKSDYIIIYCFLFASILCIAVLARSFIVKELQMAEFSGTMAFIVACLLLSAAYFGFQSFVNEWLQPCEQIKTPITVDAKLKSIDLMHFGWNIGNQFKKSGIETAIFIKQVFAKSLSDSEISTIKRKLRTEGPCIIKIKEEL